MKIVVQLTDFTLMMLSLLLLLLSMGLALLEMLLLVRGSLLLFLLKLLMRPLVDGPVRQMAHIHGDIVFLENKVIQELIVILLIGLAQQVKCTTVEALSS